jgi:hypothetical protein
MSNSNSDFYHDDPVDEKVNKKKFTSTLAFLLLAVGGTFFIQSTLAANISLNSNSPIEFGQGISQTVACSGNSLLTITPNSTFVNSSGAGVYYLSSVTVSGVPDNCDGSDFSINAYGNSDSAPLSLFNTDSTAAVIYDNAGNFEIGSGGIGAAVVSGTETFTVTFTNPVATTASIFKLTIQSGAHALRVGDFGPGNGIVYYVSAGYFTSAGSTCNTTCKYLEVAPSGWNNGGVFRSDPLTGMQWSTDTTTLTGQDLTPANQSGFANEKVNWAIGKGFYNTSLIRPTSAIAAPTLSYGATDGSTGQWFIPSMNELNELCKYSRGQATGVVTVACNTSGALKTGTSDAYGGFVDSWYWSSSEENALYAYGFRKVVIDHDAKNDTSYFRPVRAF